MGLILRIYTYVDCIGLVALEATLSLVVFHNIDFKTAAIAIILAPEFYNAIKDLGQAFHTMENKVKVPVTLCLSF